MPNSTPASAPPPMQLPAITAGARATTHQLAAGETLWSVAQHYGVSVDDLKRWNRITQARSVRAGMQLSLVGP
jgi:membrane-bound lytic murein transglycosylase D